MINRRQHRCRHQCWHCGRRKDTWDIPTRRRDIMVLLLPWCAHHPNRLFNPFCKIDIVNENMNTYERKCLKPRADANLIRNCPSVFVGIHNFLALTSCPLLAMHGQNVEFGTAAGLEHMMQWSNKTCFDRIQAYQYFLIFLVFHPSPLAWSEPIHLFSRCVGCRQPVCSSPQTALCKSPCTVCIVQVGILSAQFDGIH